MPTYLSPGVYVEEVESGARPLEGVGTAVAAFVGLAETGPFNQPTLVSNWTQFTDTFGGFVPGSYLAQSVYGYFMNGGGNCYVVRIGAGRRRERARHAPQGAAGRAAGRSSAGSACRALEPATRRRRASASRSPTRAATHPTEDMFKVVVKRDGRAGRGVRPGHRRAGARRTS